MDEPAPPAARHLDAVRVLIAEEIGLAPAEIGWDTRFEALHMDELDLVGVTLRAEHRFGVDIPDEDMNGLASVADLCALIERKLAAPPR